MDEQVDIAFFFLLALVFENRVPLRIVQLLWRELSVFELLESLEAREGRVAQLRSLVDRHVVATVDATTALGSVLGTVRVPTHPVSSFESVLELGHHSVDDWTIAGRTVDDLVVLNHETTLDAQVELSLADLGLLLREYNLLVAKLRL